MIEIQLSKGSRQVFLALDEAVQAEIVKTFNNLAHDPSLQPTRSDDHPKYKRVYTIDFSGACLFIYIVAEVASQNLITPPVTTPTHIIGVLCEPTQEEVTLRFLG